jgi:hypothetical protein
MIFFAYPHHPFFYISCYYISYDTDSVYALSSLAGIWHLAFWDLASLGFYLLAKRDRRVDVYH